MITTLRNKTFQRNLATWLIVGAALLAAWYLGPRASRRLLALLVIAMAGVALLREVRLGLLGLILAALALPLEFGTGTEVAINPATLLVPALLVLWLLDMILRRDLQLVPSRVNAPLFLFLLSGLLSLLIGNVLWDPAVSRSGHFILVQLAQWAIFAFSAGAFWLMGNLADEVWLRRLTFAFLALGGGLAILRVLPGFGWLAGRVGTIALIRAPFWVLLAALAGGQLLFNRELSPGWRLFLTAVMGAVFLYAFIMQREGISKWVGVTAAIGVLVWLRWPRLRWAMVGVALVLMAIGALFPAVYEFAGGDPEWRTSGGSRLELIQRVVEVTMRNPLTGLGPAAYRRYAAMRPLVYAHIAWLDPQISSHNNYVDLFSHVGLLGLGLFLWFMGELALLGTKLWASLREGFAGSYVSAMLATWAGVMAVMILADWFLPFVYNIGFPGFQASVLAWMFLGGLVALERMRNPSDGLQ